MALLGHPKFSWRHSKLASDILAEKRDVVEASVLLAHSRQIFRRDAKSAADIKIPVKLVQLADDNSYFVWVNEGGKATKHTVTVGEYTDYYQAGTVTINDLLDAQTLYQQSHDQFVEAFAQYEIKKREYLQATGR